MLEPSSSACRLDRALRDPGRPMITYAGGISAASARGAGPDWHHPRGDRREDVNTVPVTGGEVRGETVARGYAFLGLPYAAPPVGALRWRAPELPRG